MNCLFFAFAHFGRIAAFRTKSFFQLNEKISVEAAVPVVEKFKFDTSRGIKYFG